MTETTMIDASTGERLIGILDADKGLALTNFTVQELRKMSPNVLAKLWLDVKEANSELFNIKDAIDGILLQRLGERKATAFPSNDYDIRMVRATPNYLMDVLKAGLGEDEPELLAQLIVAEHQETVQAKLDKTAIRYARGKYGEAVDAVIDHAETPGKPRIEIKLRKEG
jgi:hypothetical protein